MFDDVCQRTNFHLAKRLIIYWLTGLSNIDSTHAVDETFSGSREAKNLQRLMELFDDADYSELPIFIETLQVCLNLIITIVKTILISHI